ncbi:hypothetical protein PROPEN_04291 [Proteus penneri ATCC 35198]|nr:hypothetical protein PROPEN_04291 [Proteus penneri ATCC 35198]
MIKKIVLNDFHFVEFIDLFFSLIMLLYHLFFRLLYILCVSQANQ